MNQLQSPPIVLGYARTGRIAWLFFLLTVGLTVPAWAQESDATSTGWLVVRHADRNGNADELTAAGKRRAEALKSLGENLRVTAIYSTDYKRTRETVQPLAEALGIDVQLYDVADPNWLDAAAEENAGGVIVVVGHSNTTPAVVRALAGVKSPEIGHDQYDQLFLIRTGPGQPSMVEFAYGQPSVGALAADADQMAPLKPRDTVGVGARPAAGAQLLLDGSREMLDKNWTYWEGPRFNSSLPIKWKVVDDPVDEGQAVMTFDPAAKGGIYGAADIVTKEAFRDFRLHVEFLIKAEGGNSGVYLQNRYEIQVLDGDRTTHGMAAVINERAAPYEVYNGVGKWNAYDIVFRAARFEDGKRVEKALVTMYFNGKKVHENVPITRVWGGPNSGMDGENDQDGNGITDKPGGLKLQAEGHEVLYRNIWIKPLQLEQADTNLLER